MQPARIPRRKTEICLTQQEFRCASETALESNQLKGYQGASLSIINSQGLSRINLSSLSSKALRPIESMQIRVCQIVITSVDQHTESSKRRHLKPNSSSNHTRELYQRLGFKVEGRRREYLWFDGRFLDYIMMGTLKDEWIEIYGAAKVVEANGTMTQQKERVSVTKSQFLSSGALAKKFQERIRRQTLYSLKPASVAEMDCQTRQEQPSLRSFLMCRWGG